MTRIAPGGFPQTPPTDREIEERSRLRLTADRRTSSLSHAIQRLVAARYLGHAPSDVRIVRRCAACGSQVHGRPGVAGGAPLDYSVAHSGQWLVLAVVGQGRIGADLERQTVAGDHDDLAETVLTESELIAYRRLPAADRPGWLGRAWVRKEAVVKLTGHGFGLDPAHVDVADGVAKVHLDAGDVAEPLPREPVLLTDLTAPAGYRASLASTVAIRVVRVYEAG